MIRHLTTLVLCGVLGSVVLVGNAEACHKRNCGHVATVCAPPCVQPAPCVKPAPCPPAPCVTRTACCMPKIKLCNFKLPSLCHRKATCAAPAPVAACAPAPAYYIYAAPAYPTPQASAQH